MKTGVKENNDESVLWWFGYVQRMENERIAKRFCEDSTGSRSVGKPWKW